MPLANYTSEIEATVSYNVEQSRYKDEEQGEVTDMELHDLWMFGREWRWSELVNEFGHKGARAIERFIFNQVEVLE